MTTPKFAMATDAKKAGYFSRRHQDRTAHTAARANPNVRNPVSKAVRRANAEARAKLKRSDEEQLKHLDKLGLTATKERAKLQARIAAKHLKPAPTKGLTRGDHTIVVASTSAKKGKGKKK